ncbi:MAG: glucosaminidase domain-containing protein [Pseudomonadota bacterium]
MFQRIVASAVAIGVVGLSANTAQAARLPEIQASPSNLAPQCATPGRLMALVRTKNRRVQRKFQDISLHYMRIGQELGVRWDYAFYQMLVETGFLTYTGDVNARQNNFAGIGATGGGVPGESFPTVAEGVRAHIQHLMLYAGMPIDNPVAERTRKVQSWGILTPWRNSLGGPVRFDQMTSKWAPGDRGYPRDLKSVADRFMRTICRGPDPQPELIAGIRDGSQPNPSATRQTAQAAPAATLRPNTQTRSSLGAPLPDQNTRRQSLTGSGNGSVAVINGGQSAPATSTQQATQTQSGGTNVGRFASNLLAAITPGQVRKPSARDPKSCRVWTASYGGQRALIIKSVSATHVNYTVLDVNQGREKREADAYIAAYAKGGTTIAEFGDPQAALTKAFKLCPTGNKAS